MQCEDVQRRLSALADGELSGFRAIGVRRHLSGCRTCAALLVDVERVSAVAADLYADAPVPVTLRSRFLANAGEMTNSLARRRFRLTGGSIAFASALVAFIGIGVGSASLYLSAQPTAAYAEIVRAMRALPFRTIHMRGILSVSDGGSGAVIAEDFWGRTDPPATASTDRISVDNSLSRSTESPGKSTIRHLDKPWKWVFRRKWITAKSLRKRLAYYSMAPDSAVGEGYETNPPFSGYAHAMHWESSVVVVDGRRLTRLGGTTGSWFRGRDSFASATLYADPKTHLLACAEYAWHYHGKGFHTIWNTIRYNETPPPDVFEDAK